MVKHEKRKDASSFVASPVGLCCSQGCTRKFTSTKSLVYRMTNTKSNHKLIIIGDHYVLVHVRASPTQSL